jgi:hypothetical protein
VSFPPELFLDEELSAPDEHAIKQIAVSAAISAHKNPFIGYLP